MSQNEKLLSELLDGAHDKSFLFSDLQKIMALCGFDLRIRGDHFIYTRKDVEEIVNLQPIKGNKAKPYQVKQVREIVIKYRLGGGLHEV